MEVICGNEKKSDDLALYIKGDTISLGQVFTCTLSDDKKIVTFTESCDNYFGVELNAYELSGLISMLSEMRNDMIEPAEMPWVEK